VAISTVKRLAADILGVGVNRIKIKQDKESLKRAREAPTREDVKALIKDGIVYAIPAKGRQKKEKRAKKGPGRRKGKKYSRKPAKELWIERVRALRKFLLQLIDKGMVDKSEKRHLYLKIKGGHFKGKKSFLNYLKDVGLLKEVH